MFDNNLFSYKKYILILLLIPFINDYSISAVKEYFITCKPSDFQKIYNNPTKNIYIPITFSYNDSTWDNAFMRLRGDGTRYLPKKSLKIKFKGDNFIDNQDKINLNAEYEDPSYIHQYLASRLYNEVGYPCFKTEHIRVYLNGKYLGLYLQIENIDERFLAKRGYDKKGNLYKARSDGSSMSVFDSVYVLWTKETNDSLHREDLRKLIDEINAVPDSSYFDFVKETFDYNKMITLIAMNMILSNASTYYHNYFLFDDIRNTKKWTVFPWDMDKTFNTYNASWPYTWSAAWSHPDNPMLERALLCDTIFLDIKNKLTQLNNTVFNSEHLFPVIDSLVHTLETSVQEDKTDNIEDSLKTWRDWVGWTKSFITKRYNVLFEQFETYPKSFRVDRTKYPFTGDVILRWHPSSTPNGEPVKYSLHYYTKPNVNLDEATHIYNIQDTSYILKGVPDGKYYWKIEAYNSVHSTEGFDKYNIFEVKTGTSLPCTIDKNMILTKDKSPYLINCAVKVNPGVRLQINEGVEIVFKDYFNLDVYGQIVAVGTKEEPVIFRPDASIKKWRVLYISKPTGICKLKNVKLINGVFKGYDGNFEFENVSSVVQDTSILDDCFYFDNSSYVFNGGNIHSNKSAEAVIAYQCQNITTENLIIKNSADAIEYVECTDGVMNNNIIYNSTDDCIDMNGSRNITISNNILMNAFDKGISIGNDGHGGGSLNILIQRNIISHCNTGLSVKSGSTVNFINNTLYNNETGIKGYEKVPNSGGATINIINSIISQSKTPISKDDKSILNISYSLCDNKLLDGEENILDNPKFIDADNNDFGLTIESPCIDAGNPESELDPDSTIADIGALYYDQKPPMIVINEINYHSSIDFDTDDWVEFYNADNHNIDISNWIFKDSDDLHIFTFPEGTLLKTDSYIVLCKDLSKFKNLFPDVNNSVGNMNFGLSGGGELIRLYDNNRKIIDSLTYDDKKPWSTEADGRGASLELINPYYDNTIAENWKASILHGTPGKINDFYHKQDSTTNDSSKVVFAELVLYPNPASNSISLLISSDEVYNFGFELFGLLSSRIPIKFVAKNFSDENKTKIITFDTSNLLNGYYFLRIKHDNNFKTLPFVILR